MNKIHSRWAFVLLVACSFLTSCSMEQVSMLRNAMSSAEDRQVRQLMRDQGIFTWPTDGEFERYKGPNRLRRYQLLDITLASDSPPTLFACDGKKLLRLSRDPEQLCEVLGSEQLDFRPSDVRWLTDLILEVMETPVGTSRLTIVNSSDELKKFANQSSKDDELAYMSNLSTKETDAMVRKCEGQLEPCLLKGNPTKGWQLRFCAAHRWVPLPHGEPGVSVNKYDMTISPQHNVRLRVTRIYSAMLEGKESKHF